MTNRVIDANALRKILLLFLWCCSISFSVAQIPTQTIRGQILDADNHNPITGANVILPGTEPVVGVTTDVNGFFEMNDIPVGRYRLKVSYIGYQTLVVPEILLESGREQVLALQLLPGYVEVTTLELRAPRFNPATEALVSKQIITVEEARRFPATFYDPARLANSYPGVVNANDQANHMIIRGNSPNHMSWRLEGVEIVNPSHTTNAGTATDRLSANGGGVNILSAQMLGTSALLTGAFPANYQNALSGVMDMQFRTGNDRRHEFTGQVGLIGIDLAAEGPLKKGTRASYLVNYRYSTLGILSALGVDLGGEAIGFQDLAFNVHLPADKAGQFTLFGMGGESSNVFTGKRDTSEWEIEKDGKDITYRSKMGAMGLTHQLRLGSRGIWRTSVVYSGLASSRVANLLDAGNTELPGVRSEVDSLMQSKLSFNTSLGMRVNDRLRFQVGLGGMRWNAATAFTIGTAFPLQAVSGTAWMLHPHFNIRWNFAKGLQANIGLNYTTFSINDDSNSLEPRVAVQWNRRKNTLSLAYGLHSQVQSPQLYFSSNSLFANPTNYNKHLGLSRSQQFVVRNTYQFNDATSLTAELYYQGQEQIPINTVIRSTFSALNLFEGSPPPFVGNFENVGRGTNYGIDLGLQQHINKDFYYLFNVSFYESKYKDVQGREWDSRFNGKYQVNLTLGKELVREKSDRRLTWGLNARIHYRGGFRESPIDEAASAIAGYTIFDETAPFTIQLPSVFRTDLRLYFRKEKSGYSNTLALDIQNATNAQNLAYRYYDSLQGKVLEENQLGLIPNLSWLVKF